VDAKTVIALFLIVCGLIGCNDPAPPAEPPAEPSAKIEAVLSTTTTSVEVTAPVLFDLTLTNRTSEPMVVMRPGDGSEWGWRTPYIERIIRDETGKVVTWPVGGRCGNTDPMLKEDMAMLQPGESVTWKNGAWIRDFSYTPGKYTVSLAYHHDPAVEFLFAGADMPGLEPMRQSKPFSVVTNAVNIECVDSVNPAIHVVQ